MSNWIKWWKNKTFMSVLGIALGTMGISFLLAYFIDWGWIPAIMLCIGGGILIRKMVTKKLDKMSEE